MTRLIGSSVIALVLSAAVKPAWSQALALPQIGTEAEVVAAANAEGAAFRRVPSPEPSAAAPRVCVVGYDIGPAHSGEFTIGGELSGGRAMRAGEVGKVWWAPLHYSHDMPPLLVRGRSLTNPRDTVRFTSARIAWPVFPGAKSVPEAERKYFFPSGITIPKPGRWLLIATSGANWGCFILTVG